MPRKSVLLLMMAAAAGLLLASPHFAGATPFMQRQPNTIELISRASDGTQGNDSSFNPAINADGRFVAFHSESTNLAPRDTNGVPDVFVHDRYTGLTERVSEDSTGSQGNASSFNPAIGADGRFVAFLSYASNLAPGNIHPRQDIFVHDRESRTTGRVSMASDGVLVSDGGGIFSPSFSTDGRFIAFLSEGSKLLPEEPDAELEVFVHDQQTGITQQISMAYDGAKSNGVSFSPSISTDGRFIAFDSRASNLVPGDTNEKADVFVHDRQKVLTERISLASNGAQGNGDSFDTTMSADGRFIAFASHAANLAPGDSNGAPDVFVHDRRTGVTELVSKDSKGNQGNGRSFSPSISGGGRFIAFASNATNLAPDDANSVVDIFVHDRQTGVTARVSVASESIRENGRASNPSISADGRFIVFESLASNLVSGDTNGGMDVFAVANPLFKVGETPPADTALSPPADTPKPAATSTPEPAATPTKGAKAIPTPTPKATAAPTPAGGGGCSTPAGAAVSVDGGWLLLGLFGLGLVFAGRREWPPRYPP